MKPRWRAYGILTAALIIIMLAILAYISAMGYFELDTERVEYTEDYVPGKELYVSNNHGKIDVRTWNRDNVEIIGVKKTYFGEDQLDNIDIGIDRSEFLKITTERERKYEWVWMDLEIHIPAGMRVHKITSSAGSVYIKGIAGNFSVEVENGKINAEEISGNINLQTENGRINLENSRGNFSLYSDNGNIFATYVDNIITAEAVNGWVHIHHTDFIGSVEVDNGEIWVKNSGMCLNADSQNGEMIIRVDDISLSGMKLRTQNGEIDVTIPKDLKANYTVDQKNGDVRFRNLDNRIGSDSFGLLNGGGPLIDIRISNGNVFLRGE
jgi:DUF4097 and DUF4098 domain-containing protein YvlB